MKNDLQQLLALYLKKIDITINNQELKFQLLSHPSYPSLHAVTGVLDHFRVDNLAAEVPTDQETLDQLPKVFFSLISIESGQREFVVVNKTNDALTIHNSDGIKSTMAVNAFLKVWTGIVVIAEKNEVTIESKAHGNKSFIKTLAIASIGVLLMAFLVSRPTYFQYFYFLMSVVGTVISCLIIRHEFGYMSKTEEKLCSVTKTTSCDAILNSNGATILKYFKLSDLSFIYFFSLAISCIIIGNLKDSLLSLLWLSIVALPVTFYSIYYQAYIAKKWCPLCLGVVGVLWLQFASIMVFGFDFTNTKITLSSLFVLVIVFLIISTLWLYVRPLLKKQKELSQLQIQYHSFKRNFDLFNAVYQKQDLIHTQIQDSNEIILGNKNAGLQFVLVTSPLCYYCKGTHTTIEQILSKYLEQVGITLRFNIGAEHKDQKAYKIINRFHELYASVKKHLK